MKITKMTKMTNQHLINRINYLRKELANMPEEAFYFGDSDYAKDAVKAGNARNDVIADDIREHIQKLEKELKNRKIKYKEVKT